MINVSQIRDQLAQLQAGQLSLDAFEQWFVERSWNAHQDDDVIDLVFRVENQFSQAQNDVELKKGLAEILASLSATPTVDLVVRVGNVVVLLEAKNWEASPAVPLVLAERGRYVARPITRQTSTAQNLLVEALA